MPCEADLSVVVVGCWRFLGLCNVQSPAATAATPARARVPRSVRVVRAGPGAWGRCVECGGAGIGRGAGGPRYGYRKVVTVAASVSSGLGGGAAYRMYPRAWAR